MRNRIHIFVWVVMLCVSAVAEDFRDWTRDDGTTAKLRLVGKSGEGEEMKAKFKMANGTVVEFPISQLAKEDAEYVKNWDEGSSEDSKEGGVFDAYFNDSLVKLKGNSFEKYVMSEEPEKYYLFYYTASWCGPCQAFTPSLVAFYKQYAEKHDQFEIILISSDDSEADMRKYAKSKGMEWPHLKLSKVKSFERKFKHPGRGIPNLVLTDVQGEILKTSYEGKAYIGPTAVMRYLEGLLK